MSDTTLPVASGDGGNMGLDIRDPNNTSPLASEGGGPFSGKEVPMFGKTKITPTGPSADSRDQHINGDKVSYNGLAPSGENSSGIPAAQPIDPLTYGDPNDSAVDAKDGYSVTGTDEERHGF